LDYSRGRVTLRLPTNLHELFLMNAIEVILQRLAPAMLTGQFFPTVINALQLVQRGGSPDIQLGSCRHGPDATLFHPDANAYTFVVEISYAQKRKDLKYLAYDYLVRSGGKIHALLGLDLEYRGSKTATVSLWRVVWDVTADGRPLLRHEKTVSEQVNNCPNLLMCPPHQSDLIN
jgi:hypothetical protein